MKDSRCQICKYIGRNTVDDIYTSQIYRGAEESLKIHLCYLHNWEFFKIGQVKFILKYRHNFLNHFGTEQDSDLIDYVRYQPTGN